MAAKRKPTPALKAIAALAEPVPEPVIQVESVESVPVVVEPAPVVAPPVVRTGCVSCGGQAIRRDVTPADIYVVTMSNGAVMEVMSETAAKSVVGRYGGGYSVRKGT